MGVRVPMAGQTVSTVGGMGNNGGGAGVGEVLEWLYTVGGGGLPSTPLKQDKSFRGSVDTTKTRSGPQRVRMGSGERPIGAAKGKQSDTEALCQPPPPPD